MNFSKASVELGYAQSTVTAQINQLEQELGVSLFDRNGKHISLNPKGEELLYYANQIISLESEARCSVSDLKTPKGLLRIGVLESIDSFFLPKLLNTYLQRYPLVQVEVHIAKTLKIMEMLRQNQIDLMITLDDKLSDRDWICPWECKEKIIFLCSPYHPFAKRDSVPLEEVIQENLLLTEKYCNYRQSLEHLCNARNLNLHPILEIGSTSTILSLTESNLGISFLPEHTALESLNKGILSTFPIQDVEFEMLIQLIYRRSKWCSPAMQTFTELAAETICQILSK